MKIETIVLRLKKLFRASPQRIDPSEIRLIPIPTRIAGIRINEDTALRFSAVFRAISYISQTIACLPWDLILETQSRTIKLVGHPVWNLLHSRPNPEMNAITFKETLISWALGWGNGYAEIERDKSERPIALWPISPNRVIVKRDPETKEIYYEITNYSDQIDRIPAKNIFHLHGLGFDGLTGYSVINFANRSIAIGMAAESFAADFFANGAVTTGALKHPKVLSETARENLRKSIEALMVGEGKRFRIPILEEGMDWVNMMINPEDAQLLLTREFQVREIARWFGLPPHKLMDLGRATWANIEHQSIEVVNDALMPWILRLEQEADAKLIKPSEKNVRTKINVRGLLRGDDKTRAEYYRIMRTIGVYSTNDIRRLEDMDPVGPEGDELLVQVNQITLKQLVENKKQNGFEEDTSVWQSHKLLFSSAYDRILRREFAQFERDKGKIKNLSDFYDWFEAFFMKEKIRIKRDVEPIASSFLLQHSLKFKLNGNMYSAINLFIDWHIEESKRLLSEIIMQKTDDFCETQRMKEAEDRFFSYISAILKAKEEINYAPSERAFMPVESAGQV